MPINTWNSYGLELKIMLSISIFKKIIKINYIFFYNGRRKLSEKKWVSIFVQSEVDVGGEEFLTSHIDLNQNEKLIWSLISKGFQSEIKKAEKESWQLCVDENPSMNEISKVVIFFNDFATNKKIAKADLILLNALSVARGLCIAYISSNDGLMTVCNFYICDNCRSRLLYSSNNLHLYTDSSQIIGRNSKLLHWRMITYFKNRGYGVYDLGGLSKINEIPHSQINKYKRSFGGKDVVEYNKIQFRQDFIGRVFEYIYNVKRRCFK